MILTQTDQTTKTAIRYDRSKRQWLAVNGTTTAYATKNEALMAALKQDHPQLAAKVHEVARAHGYGQTIVTGLLKAAALVAKDKVYANGEVASQSRTDVYHRVKFGGKDGMTAKYSCSCEATVRDAVLGKTCAHSLAQHLAYLLGLDLPDAPIPFGGEPVVVEGRADWPGLYDGSNGPGYTVDTEINF